MKVMVVLVIGLGLLVAGCGSQEAKKGAPAVEEVTVAPEAARMITDEFMRELKSELLAAMQAGGATEAIAVCNTRAPEIAASHAKARVWSIERVSDEPRVPEHMATEHEAAILERFRDTLLTEQEYTEWVVGEAGDSSLMYYRPIRMGELCTNCHGNQDKLAPGVPELLTELYPEDQAVGYEAGDLRGMFVVSMRWPEAKAAAEELVAGQSAEGAQGEQ